MEEKKLHPWPVALALSLVTGIIYLFCALLIWVFPTGTIRFFSYWFHGIDISKIAATTPINLSVFIIGLISIMIFSVIVGAIFAGLYNKCLHHCIKKGWIG